MLVTPRAAATPESGRPSPVSVSCPKTAATACQGRGTRPSRALCPFQG